MANDLGWGFKRFGVMCIVLSSTLIAGCSGRLVPSAHHVQSTLQNRDTDPARVEAVMQRFEKLSPADRIMAFLGTIAPPGLLDQRERKDADFAPLGSCDEVFLDRLIELGVDPTHKVAYVPSRNEWRWADDKDTIRTHNYKDYPIDPLVLAPGIRLDHAAVAWCSPEAVAKLRSRDWFRLALETIVYARTPQEAHSAGQSFWRVMTPTSAMELQLMVGLDDEHNLVLSSPGSQYCEGERTMEVVRQNYRALAMSPSEEKVLRAEQEIHRKHWEALDRQLAEATARRLAAKAKRREQFAATVATIATIAAKVAPVVVTELNGSPRRSGGAAFADALAKLEPQYFTGGGSGVSLQAGDIFGIDQAAADPRAPGVPDSAGELPGSSATSPTTFTCTMGDICVEYTMWDLDEARQTRAQCAASTSGHGCPPSGVGKCYHRAKSPRKQSTTYTRKPPANHNELCTNNGGTLTPP